MILVLFVFFVTTKIVFYYYKNRAVGINSSFHHSIISSIHH